MYGSNEPIGTYANTILDIHGTAIGYLIKTISIVPISTVIRLEDIYKLTDNKIILKMGSIPISLEHFKTNVKNAFVFSDNMKKAITSDFKLKKIKDMRFDVETGQICDIVVLKNIIVGKETIPVNNIFAKDNTIYINEGRE